MTNNGTISNKAEIAKEFNNYFATAGTNLSSAFKIPRLTLLII